MALLVTVWLLSVRQLCSKGFTGTCLPLTFDVSTVQGCVWDAVSLRKTLKTGVET